VIHNYTMSVSTQAPLSRVVLYNQKAIQPDVAIVIAVNIIVIIIYAYIPDKAGTNTTEGQIIRPKNVFFLTI